MNPKAINVFIIRATLEWSTPVWRDIEIRENQTLMDLHDAIQDAFQWYNDHLYAFFMSGSEWNSDNDLVYSEPESLRQEGTDNPNERGANVRLAGLDLRVGQKVAYVYDFGDNLSLMLKVRDIAKIIPTVRYPRTTALRGYSPEEYHYHIGYSKEIRRELRKGLPDVIRLDPGKEKDILKQWSDTTAVGWVPI